MKCNRKKRMLILFSKCSNSFLFICLFLYLTLAQENLLVIKSIKITIKNSENEITQNNLNKNIFKKNKTQLINIIKFHEKTKIGINFLSHNITIIPAQITDKVDMDIKKLDLKLEKLSQMIENYEKNGNSSTSKTEIYSKNVKEKENIESKKITLNLKELEMKNGTETKNVAYRKDISNSSLESPTATNNFNESTFSQYHTLTIMEEMDLNIDERNKKKHFQLYLFIALVIYVYLFFTWKLSRKNQKFPANLINSLFTSNLLLVTIILTTQKTNKNLVFEKIGIIVSLIVDYYNISVNILYFISVILIINIENAQELKKISKIIRTLWNYLYLLLAFCFICLFFCKFNIKNCFIGSCIVDKNLKNSLQILPYQIQFFVFILLFGFLIYTLLKGQTIENKDYSENFRNLNTENGKFIEEKMISNHVFNILKNNSTLSRILIYEIFYFIYNSFDSYIKSYKINYLTNFRYEDFCSIHDYHIIIKAVLLFLFVGFNKSDFSEWKSAFQDKNLERENSEAEELINQINKIKLEKH